jgi:hypothetical protein
MERYKRDPRRGAIGEAERRGKRGAAAVDWVRVWQCTGGALNCLDSRHHVRISGIFARHSQATHRSQQKDPTGENRLPPKSTSGYTFPSE